jgi:hypothetical protein
MNKYILLINAFFLINVSTLLAQNSVNNYKYILVPKQFEFQKSEDAYQINSLTKFLFDRAGYNVLFTDDTYPNDLANNGCLALKVVVKNNPTLLATKMSIDLVDCYNNVVYATSEGRSKEKDYKRAYHEAIRITFEDLEALNYEYKPVITKSVIVSEAPKEELVKKKEVAIVPVKEDLEKEVLQPKKEEVAAVVQQKVIAPIKEELVEVKNINYTIEGTYLIGNWGKSTITKEGDSYIVKGGDENFEFATIYSTSKPAVYIIKWAAFKQPQLVELTSNGSLKVDSENGVKTYTRAN